MIAGRLTVGEARSWRLASLCLSGRSPRSARSSAARSSAGACGEALLDVVTWFGAMQAQDVRSLTWSLGVRLPGTTAVEIAEAMEARTVVRTWPMRGTLHLVPARDVRWMLDLMAGRRAATEIARRAQLGLTEAEVDRAVDVLGGALADGGRLTRGECVDVLAAAGLPVEGQAAYHLLGAACRRGVVCLAPDRGASQTFALLDDWAPDQRSSDRDEALATIALRYVRSHGPAHRRDLAGWTGLTLGDVDRGVAAAGDGIGRVEVEGVDLLVAPPSGAPERPPAASHLVLPGFDEFVLGYKDRSLLMGPDALATVVPGGNGMFRATVVRRGRVVGVWTRTVTRGDHLVVVPHLLEPLGAGDRAAFADAFEAYARFLGATSLDVRWP